MPSVTGKVYNVGVAAELRLIVGEPAPKIIEQEVRLAAYSNEIVRPTPK